MNIDRLKLVELSNDEFEKFASTHKLGNFFQSKYMKELYELEGKNVYLLALKDTKKVVCATLIVESSRFLKYYTYEATKGYLIDYNNIELISKFTDEIIKFLKKRGGYRLIIDPNIVRVSRNIDGNVTNDIDNRYILSNLKRIGFKETKGCQVKWTFVKDTNSTYEKLYKEYKANTKNIVNKVNNKYHLLIEELPYDKLDVFKNITLETSKRKGFRDKSLLYYQRMYKVFKDKLKVLICKIDLKLYLDELSNELNKLNGNYISTSNIKKKNSIKSEIKLINDKVNEVSKLIKNDRYLILSGAMFILYNGEITYLFSGSIYKYMKYCGIYKIIDEMIRYASCNGFSRFNFYGIDENFKSDGVYEFKKGFNGYVEELLGCLEIKINYTYYLHNLFCLIKKICKK